MPTCHVCGQEFPYDPQGKIAYERHVDEHYGDVSGSEKDVMFATGEPMDIAMRLLKNYIPDWHLRQRFPEGQPITEVKRWEKMPHSKAKTTHGFKGEPIPEDILANPPSGEPQPINDPKAWSKLVQGKLMDIDENPQARADWDSDIHQAGEPMDIAWRLLKMPFHGTTEDAVQGGRFFGGIKRRGIEPRKSRGGVGQEAAFFTDKPSDAAGYAKTRAGESGSRPVMIHFPESSVPKDSQQMPSFAGDYRYSYDKIPPKDFTYNYGPERAEGVSDEQYGQQMTDWQGEMDKKYPEYRNNLQQQLGLTQPQPQQQAQGMLPPAESFQDKLTGEPMALSWRLLKSK